MFESAASGLSLWPSLYLIAGGAGKALDWSGSRGRASFLGRLLPASSLLATWRALGVGELAIGLAMLFGMGYPWVGLGAVALLAGAGAAAIWAIYRVPDAECGCLGRLGRANVSWMTVGRAALLATLALVAVLGGNVWTAAFESPIAAVASLSSGAALLALTPELRVRTADLRRSNSAGKVPQCATEPIPLAETLASLRRSSLWFDAQSYLRSQAPNDHWREACWRFITFPAKYANTPATAVFAVYLGASDHSNAVAFVADATDEVLGELAADDSVRRTRRRRWRLGLVGTAVVVCSVITAAAIAACDTDDSEGAAANATLGDANHGGEASASYPTRIYPRPEDPRHDWGLPQKCASPRRVGLLPKNPTRRAIRVLGRLGGNVRDYRRFADRAFWPQLSTFEEPLYEGRPPPHEGRPASATPNAEFIRNNCGRKLMRRSWSVVFGASPGLESEFLLLRRKGRWLVWLLYP